MIDSDPHRLYVPRGSARALLLDRRTEILVSGPAGTGKSRAAMEKLHRCAEKYPGMRGLILRKTRESLTESALVTWETKVLPEGHPALAGPTRASRHSYRYPNGSEVIVGGLRQSGRDLTQKVMSTEYDLIYIQEAIELTEEEWERATTRLRNGKMPYQQLIADTNPDAPMHWLKRRCDAGVTILLDSRHADNPVLTGPDGTPTAVGAVYLARLDALTGTRRLRLRDGRWVQAEGVVYDGWDRSIHVIDPFPIPASWGRLWAVDFGYTAPFVWQAWARDPDGRLYLYHEIYRTQTLVEDHARRIRQLTQGEPLPEAIVCDHDREDRATLEKHLGLATTAAIKSGTRPEGIQYVAERLRPAGDGKPRLFVLRGCLDGRDPVLDEAKRPCCLEEEMDAYVWDLRGGARKGDVPVKEHDHSEDAMRYLVFYAESSGPWTFTPADRRDSLVGRLPNDIGYVPEANDPYADPEADHWLNRI